MDDPTSGPLMVDLTALVRKPKLRTAWGRFLIPVREATIGLAAFVASIPFSLFLFGFAPVAGMLVPVFSVALAVFASQAKADGQPITRFLLSAVRGRVGRHYVDGQWVPVYVGLARVRDFHDGRPTVLHRSALEIHPDLVDDRGHITMPDTT